MEPDHAATIGELIARYPSVKLVGNAKTNAMLKQFFDFDVDGRFVCVKEGDTLCSGKHTLHFVMSPMVHWPETMVSYDSTDKILFSADAFGTFGALSGNIFADELGFDEVWMDDARRYYTNIVGKYGTQVQTLLKKAETLQIEMLCPLHGPVWRTQIERFIEKYQLWSSYASEDQAVLIIYGSIYGHTANAADILAAELAARGVTHTAMYDVSVTHPSVIVSEAFRCSHIVFASSTYNAGIFCNMETVLLDMKAHNLQNRQVAFIENGTWAATSGKLMREIAASMKNMTVLEGNISLKSSVKEADREQLAALAETIANSMKAPSATTAAPAAADEKIDGSALHKLSYGLFVLSARDGDKDNACIVNTVTQIAEKPKTIGVSVNKANYTHDMIKKTKLFNVSILTEEAPFRIFQQFGFQSGKNVDKFADYDAKARAENGLYYLTECANALLSCKVISVIDCGSHSLFIAELTQAKTLSAVPSVTYAYYFANIKPKPKKAQAAKKGFVCKICGYVYEGETLPPDFICPICKHGAEDFEPLPEIEEKPKKGFVCKICGFVYEGETLPPDYICPICKHGAEDFEPLG